MARELKIIQAYHRKCKGEGRINSQHCGKKKGILLKGIRIRRFWLSARIFGPVLGFGYRMGYKNILHFLSGGI